MTTMDSDSESQDSDDGRRFRFEATRKDAAAHVEPSNKSKSSRKKAKHKSRTHRDRKEKSKYESSSGRKDSRSSKDRDANDKDLRHAIKQSRSSVKHEDGKTAHKEHRESFDSKDRRDSKRYRGRDRDRDRSSHHKQRSRDRSRERSHDRNHEDQSDRHRSRCGDRSKYHSRKSRDRSSNKHRSPESDRSRDGRHDASRRTPKKDVKSEQKESVRRSANDESHSNDRADNQDCKDIDLSDYDVLSETDENMSDASDSPSRSPHYHKSKIKKRDPDEGSEGLRDGRQSINSEHRSGEVLHKVNPRNSEPTMSSSSSSGSSNNNPSAVSDFLLGSASSATSARAREYMNNDKEMAERCGTKDKPDAGRAKLVSDSTDDESRLGYSSLDEDAESRENNKKPDSSRSLTDTDGSTYGPALPPKLASSPYAPLSSSDEKWTDCRTDSQPGSRLSPVSQAKCDSSEECDGKSDGKSAKGRAFIGPCLPETDTHEEDVTASKEALSSSRNSVYRSDSDNEDVGGRLSVDQDASGSSLVSYKDAPDDGDVAFGPALPPHLLQKSQDRIIGPAMPDSVESCMEIECAKSSDSEDGDAIGPLPMDHPALRSSLVHEQLEHRAKKIKDQLQDETESVASKREEWMTELPSARASNLGLAPRKFRVTPAPDMSDRSCWTDTPAQKAQKLKDQALKKSGTAESEKIPVSKVAKEDSGSRKREKSLLEVHQEKLQKKKKKEEKEAKSEERTYRRPFDRDIDLQANRLDKVQKKAIFMKAQLLNDRFSRGEI